MAKRRQIDLLVWAHSDQSGGTEIPCILVSALRKHTGDAISCGIWTPYPDAVIDFFKLEGGTRGKLTIFSDKPWLKLKKDETGARVDGLETCKYIQNKLLPRNWKKFVADWATRLRPRLHENSLIISCGDPLGVAVAEECKCKAIMVTDHVLTQTINQVLCQVRDHVPKDVWEFITDLEAIDKKSDAVLLSPPEFGVPTYRDYFLRDCLEIGGLFYDPIPIHELKCAPHYDELKALNDEYPLVIVFGGGGDVWNEIYVELDRKARKELTEFSLILRDVIHGHVLPRTWRLFTPKDPSGKPLQDPGRMMYWYAACTLLVGRGGLAAQQVIATLLGSERLGPGMVFIQEPNHPQIESERRELSREGIVRTYELDHFRKHAFELIKKELRDKERFKKESELVRLRYSRGCIDKLADHILEAYTPHKRPIKPDRIEDPYGPYNYSSTLLDDVLDRRELPGPIEEKLLPLQFELHLPPRDPSKPCWFNCPFCYRQVLSHKLPRSYPRQNVFVRTVKDVKGKVPRIVISGLYSDPLLSDVLIPVLTEAKTGGLMKVGLHTKLVEFPNDLQDILRTEFTHGDYVTVSLNTASQRTFSRITGGGRSSQLKAICKNLKTLCDIADQRGFRANVTCLLIPSLNANKNDIEKLHKLSKTCGAHSLRFSVPQYYEEAQNEVFLNSSVPDFLRELECKTEGERPSVIFKDFSLWSVDGIRRCFSQLLHPALGADGYFYPCCQVASPTFKQLRIAKARVRPRKEEKDNWNMWLKSETRKKFVYQSVGNRGADGTGHLGCRICNRKDGCTNVLLNGLFME